MRNDPTQVLISGIRHVVSSRPPYLQPRPRDVDPAEVDALRSRMASGLAIYAGARIEITEWIAFDPRDVPHTTMLTVIEPTQYFSVAIGKEISQVTARDICECLGNSERWRADD